jgi:hypothetical protein
MTEFAPGIPSKQISHELPEVSKPTKWEMVVHDHAAERRGRHFDLRLGDPATGHAHSWAMPAKWPEPGERSWAIQQPTHTVKYMDFEGTIEDGYGKGDVTKHRREKTEIVSSTPGHINFNIYTGAGPEEYTLHRIADNKWMLLNRTIHREKTELPDTRPPYREVKLDKAARHIDDPDMIASAKIDDAHNLFVLPASGDQVRVVSYRLAKRSKTGLIEHTHKVPSLFGVETPPGLGGTILRGGLYAMDPKTGKAVHAKDLASLLNSSVWKSRENQKQIGELIPVVYDVVKYKGRNMETASYGEKLKILLEVADKLPFELPRIAVTSEDKAKLIEDIRTGKVPETTEGVVFWNIRKGEAPVKAKFVKDHDVYIRDFFPGEGKYKGKGVGGFLYSHEPHGSIVGRVGTGLSDELRTDMHQHPDKYKGLVARVTAQDKFPSGALRAPAFQDWHLDKNEPQALANVKVAAALDKTLLFLWDC